MKLLLFTLLVMVWPAKSEPKIPLPSNITPDLFCKSCVGVITEAEKSVLKKGMDSREVRVVETLETICKDTNFRIYQYSPPKMSRGCKFIMDNWEDEFEEALMKVKEGDSIQNYICFELTGACVGIDLEKADPNRQSDVEFVDSNGHVKTTKILTDSPGGSISLGADGVVREGLLPKGGSEEVKEKDKATKKRAEQVKEVQAKLEKEREKKEENKEKEVEKVKEKKKEEKTEEKKVKTKDTKKENVKGEKSGSKGKTLSKKKKSKSKKKKTTSKLKKNLKERMKSVEEKGSLDQLNIDINDPDAMDKVMGIIKEATSKQKKPKTEL